MITKKIDFDFDTKYNCLSSNVIRTIRGAGRVKRFKFNQKVTLGYKGLFIKYGIILTHETARLESISIKDLNDWLGSESNKIENKYDAMNEINRTRKFHKLNSLSDKLSIFTILKLGANSAD